MDKGHRKLREAALNRYYIDPAICKNCHRVIKVKDGQKPADVKKKTFCDHSCSAIFSNKGRKKEGIFVCPSCGGRNGRRSFVCMTCRQEYLFEKSQDKTLGECILRGNARVKFSQVRKMATRAMKRWGVEKTCEECDGHKFDKVVQVHHVRSISDFPESALIREVNSRENLRYLCPSHHALDEL